MSSIKQTSENVLVSACLLGTSCRWHGKEQRISSFVQRFQKENPAVNFISVCPEVLGGLPTPRPPVKRKKGRVYETCPEKEDRKNVTGKDVTEFFQKGAELTLAIAKENHCKLAILCKFSPSCDSKGITGKLLTENGVKVINTY